MIARGWCEAHYRRWKRTGDPLATKRAAWASKYDAADGFKLCSLCETRKPVAEFHASKAARDGLQQRCKPCQSKRTAETRNRARAKEWRRAHYEANADELRRKRRDYHAENSDRERAYGRLYHQKNRDRKRLYDQTRREARAGQSKAWRTPERSREFVARRRAQKLAAAIGDPQETLAYAEILRGDPCSYCGHPSDSEDHIQPLSRGGAHAWWNLTACCRWCNSQKNNRDLLEYLLLRLPA